MVVNLGVHSSFPQVFMTKEVENPCLESIKPFKNLKKNQRFSPVPLIEENMMKFNQPVNRMAQKTETYKKGEPSPILDLIRQKPNGNIRFHLMIIEFGMT